MSNFYERLKYSIDKSDDEMFDKLYKRMFPMLESIEFVTDKETQKRGIDKILRFSNGSILTIDEKKREKYYGDILIELMSNFEKKTLGWLYTANCDYIAYAVMPIKTCYMLPMQLMRAAYLTNKQKWHDEGVIKYGKTDDSRGNVLYTTQCLCVKTESVLDGIANEMRRSLQ